MLSVIYFYLPGAVANIGANLSRFIPIFRKIDFPIDGRILLKGKPLIGEHKSWGGFLCGLIFGLLFGILKLTVLDRFWPGELFVLTSGYTGIFLAFLLSFGALSGDIVKSIAKRIIGVEPHRAWIPYDEIDHTIMSMILVKIFFGINWNLFFWVIGIYFVLHLVANVIGFKLKIKRVPY